MIHTFEHLDTTLAFYQVDSVGALSAYADGCLDVYVDGAYVAAVKIDMTKLFNRFILKEVLPLLKPLEAEYPAVKSGAKFSFTFHFEDKKGEFIPSEKTPRSGEVTYTW